MAEIVRYFRVRNKRREVFYGKETCPGHIKRITKYPWSKYAVTSETYSLNQLTILPPVKPGKIIAVGLNYKDHIEEMGKSLPEEPVIFFKSVTSLIGTGQNIRLPRQSKRVDYEAELAIIIGKKGWEISETDADKYIAGYTCLNDVTARDIQKQDGQWCRAKSYPTFCPAGPCITSGIEANSLTIRLFKNTKLQQESNTSQLLFSPQKLISFISTVMPLYPGDIIATGTPSGIGPMKPGDCIEIEIEDVGRLMNHVC